MKSSESFGVKSERSETARHYRDDIEFQREALGNLLFEQYMRGAVLKDFLDALEEEDFSEEQMQNFRSALGSLSNEEAFAILSLPSELRSKYVEKLKLDIVEGKNISSIVKERAKKAKEYGFRIGFHTSPIDIKPKVNGEWVIKGSEKDHRDGDIPMAYYSSKYRHLFKMKHPKFIYVVRTEPDHRTDGNWSRAPSLSIVTSVPFEQVFNYVEKEIRLANAKEREAQT